MVDWISQKQLFFFLRMHWLTSGKPKTYPDKAELYGLVGATTGLILWFRWWPDRCFQTTSIYLGSYHLLVSSLHECLVLQRRPSFFNSSHSVYQTCGEKFLIVVEEGFRVFKTVWGLELRATLFVKIHSTVQKHQSCFLSDGSSLDIYVRLSSVDVRNVLPTYPLKRPCNVRLRRPKNRSLKHHPFLVINVGQDPHDTILTTQPVYLERSEGLHSVAAHIKACLPRLYRPSYFNNCT